MESQISRRNVLIGASAGAGGLVLAACSSSATDSKAAAAAPGTTGSSPAPASGAAASTPGTSTAATAANALVALADIPVGGSVAATGSGSAKLLISQPTKGKVVAFSAICTHMSCIVAPGPTSLNCPCHGSIYDLATGVPTHGPATKALTPVKVDVVDGKVVEAL